MQGETPPSFDDVARIIDFETHLYTSQIYDDSVGDIKTRRIGAGPATLRDIPFFAGINDAFGSQDKMPRFDPNVFTFYRDWLQAAPHTADQLSVARGEQLFNTRKFVISGVTGLNDLLGRPKIVGTCSSCHSTPAVGSNPLPRLLNTGVADGALRTPDLPLYTLRNKRTGQVVQTTDPGAAMTTGKWADIGKFKVPSLRSLETQSPYMHNGMSGDLRDILDFYDTRFKIGLSTQEKQDLKAFLTTL